MNSYFYTKRLRILEKVCVHILVIVNYAVFVQKDFMQFSYNPRIFCKKKLISYSFFGTDTPSLFKVFYDVVNTDVPAGFSFLILKILKKYPSKSFLNVWDDKININKFNHAWLNMKFTRTGRVCNRFEITRCCLWWRKHFWLRHTQSNLTRAMCYDKTNYCYDFLHPLSHFLLCSIMK